jgi:hypothetical protein
VGAAADAVSLQGAVKLVRLHSATYTSISASVSHLQAAISAAEGICSATVCGLVYPRITTCA